jgi:hypothetical protein
MDHAIRLLRAPVPAPATIFAVVGERRDDPNHLLLLGDDGRLYDLPLPDDLPLPVEPDEAWVVDAAVAVMEAVMV